MSYFRYSQTVRPHENSEPQFSHLARLLLATRRLGSVHEARLPVILQQNLIDSSYITQRQALASSEGTMAFASSDGKNVSQGALSAARYSFAQQGSSVQTFAQDDLQLLKAESPRQDAKKDELPLANVTALAAPNAKKCERHTVPELLALDDCQCGSWYGDPQQVSLNAGNSRNEQCYRSEVRAEVANRNPVRESDERYENLLILHTSPPKRESIGQVVICAPTSALCTSVFKAEKQAKISEHVKASDIQAKTQISSSLPAVYNNGTQHGPQCELPNQSFGAYTYSDDDFMKAVRAVLRESRASQRYVFGENPGFW